MDSLQPHTLNHKLIDALYTDTIILTDEARGYFDDPSQEVRDILKPELKILFACASLMLTTRLMHLTVWIIAMRNPEQKIAPVLQALPASSEPDRAQLPTEAQILIRAGDALYNRAMRLGYEMRKRPRIVSLVLQLRRSLAPLIELSHGNAEFSRQRAPEAAATC